MTWHLFLGAIRVPALRDLPIAYALVVVVQGGYFLSLVRRWVRPESR